MSCELTAGLTTRHHDWSVTRMATASIDHDRSGIYQIVNTINGKRYIGSAVNIRCRWNEHRSDLRNGKHHSRVLLAAWTKYGEGAFKFSVLMFCGRSELILYEQMAMDCFKPEYNSVSTAGNTLGRKHSDETKAKIAAKATGRVRSRESIEQGAAKRRGVKLSPSHRATLLGNKRAAGLKHTDEWKRENSIRNTGAKRPKSPEQRAKIAAALMGIPHSPERRARQAAAQVGLKRRPYNLKPRT